jgi:glycosyltransferase involved in cell wall biosynthesis
MRIVIGIYYYLPYISGLSVYTRRLAAALTQRGHEVTIITSRHDPALEPEEMMDGVRVRRIPVWFRLDKGAIMPGFVPALLRAGRAADVINLHLPMAEASVVALFAPHKTVITYHCDVRLNKRNPLTRLVERAIFRSMRFAIRHSRAAVTQSFDYAANTKVLHRFLDRVVVIPPPMALSDGALNGAIPPEYFQQRAQVPPGGKTIGFVGRIVYEKGLDFLIHAFYDLQKLRNDVYLVIAGDYRDVAGGSVKATLMRFLSGRDERIRFVGRLTDPELDAFYRFIDVLALPSIDPLEAYGMVQVEAMTRGRPVVATDLPGVRTIVQRTGMGQIVRRRDPHALAQALERVLYEHAFTPRTPAELVHLLDLGDTTSMYEDLFRKVANGEQV